MTKKRKQIAISSQANDFIDAAMELYKAQLLERFGLTTVTKFDVANFLIKKGYDAFMQREQQPPAASPATIPQVSPTPSTDTPITSPQTAAPPIRSGRLESADGDIFADNRIEVDTDHLPESKKAKKKGGSGNTVVIGVKDKK